MRCCSTLALTLMGETPIGDKLSPIGELKGVRGPLSLAERGSPTALLGVQCKQKGGGIFKKCVTSQAVYPLSEQHGLEAQERR